MKDKHLRDCDAKESDARWRATHEQMIAERKEMLLSDGKLTPREAERRATELQNKVTPDARRQFERS